MRSFFGFLAFAAVLIALVVGLLVPTLVAPMVVSAVRDASPFGEQPLDVEADVDAIGLIRGFVGEIRVSGTDLVKDEVRIGKLAVTINGAGIGDHDFAAISGGLQRVSVSMGGQPLTVDRIELSGASEAVTAVAHLDYAASIAFLEWSFADAGLTVSDIELVDGGLSLVTFEQRVELAVGAEDGALVVPDILGAGRLDLLMLRPDDQWRITGASVTPNGIEIQALVDAAGVLAGT